MEFCVYVYLDAEDGPAVGDIINTWGLPPDTRVTVQTMPTSAAGRTDPDGNVVMDETTP
jgi:hypothetical protein